MTNYFYPHLLLANSTLRYVKVTTEVVDFIRCKKCQNIIGHIFLLIKSVQLSNKVPDAT